MQHPKPMHPYEVHDVHSPVNGKVENTCFALKEVPKLAKLTAMVRWLGVLQGGLEHIIPNV